MTIRTKNALRVAAVMLLTASTSSAITLLMTRAVPPKVQSPPPETCSIPFGAWRMGVDPDNVQNYSFLIVRNEAPVAGWLEFAIDTYLWQGPKLRPGSTTADAVRLKVEVFAPEDEEGADAPLLVRYSDVFQPSIGIAYRQGVPFREPLLPGSYPVRVTLETLPSEYNAAGASSMEFNVHDVL